MSTKGPRMLVQVRVWAFCSKVPAGPSLSLSSRRRAEITFARGPEHRSSVEHDIVWPTIVL